MKTQIISALFCAFAASTAAAASAPDLICRIPVGPGAEFAIRKLDAQTFALAMTSPTEPGCVYVTKVTDIARPGGREFLHLKGVAGNEKCRRKTIAGYLAKDGKNFVQMFGEGPLSWTCVKP